MIPLVAAGCGGSQAYIRPDYDFTFVRRCAVLPFQNLTPDRFADERVRSIFVMELLEDGSLAVVDPEETASAMREIGLPTEAPLEPEQTVALGKALAVEAVFFGTVEEYGMARRSGVAVNQVTAGFGMAETQTGTLVWQSHVDVDGTSIWRKLFGGGSASLHDVSRAAVRKALGSLL